MRIDLFRHIYFFFIFSSYSCGTTVYECLEHRIDGFIKLDALILSKFDEQKQNRDSKWKKTRETQTTDTFFNISANGQMDRAVCLSVYLCEQMRIVQHGCWFAATAKRCIIFSVIWQDLSIWQDTMNIFCEPTTTSTGCGYNYIQFICKYVYAAI